MGSKRKDDVAFILVYALIVVAFVFAFGGCVKLSPEAKGEMDQYKSRMAAIAGQGLQLKEEVITLTQKVKELEGQGEWAQAQSAMQAVVAKKDEIDALIAEGTAIQGNIQALSAQYDVPWWQIGGEGLLAILGVLAGAGGGLAARSSRIKLGAAESAVQTLVRAIEKEKAETVKLRVKKEGNDLIEGVVREIT